MEEASSCLELLLASFCKHFQLKPKQAAGLLTHQAKYFIHIVNRGLRGQFDPIVGWYQDIYANLKTVTQLIAKERTKGSLTLMLSLMRPGLTSRSIEVTLWCCRLLTKLAADLVETNMQSVMWDVNSM